MLKCKNQTELKTEVRKYWKIPAPSRGGSGTMQQCSKQKGVDIYDRKEKYFNEKHSWGGVIRVL